MLLSGSALVTGAGSGIGRQLSLAYARAGAKALALADMNQNGIVETTRLLEAEFPDVKVLQIVVDVTDEDSVNKMVDKAVQEFGRLDHGGQPSPSSSLPFDLPQARSNTSFLLTSPRILAANAAGVIVNSREKTAYVLSSEYDRVMNINARAVALCMQAEARAMLKQTRKVTSGYWTDEDRGQVGSIVNFASVCGFVAMPNVMPYVASKHAVMGITRSAAIEHGPEGLRVNAVCPGIVDTPFIANLKASKGGNVKDPVFANPHGRLCKPDEIADAVIFLSSTMSSYVNGEALVADGGKTAQY